MNTFSVNNLTVTKGNTKILDSLTFDIEQGDFVCIVGPSGAGKSTLLRQLNRLDYGMTGGNILWNDKDLGTYDIHKLRQDIAYIFQKAVMFPGTCEQNIRMGCMYEKGLSKDEIDQRLEAAIEKAEITKEMLKVKAEALSGGQQQRVGIARCLMLNPQVLLFDEPTASLDVETSHNFCLTLKTLKSDIKAKKSASLMITHRLEEAQFLADKILMLDAGKIVAYVPVDDFFNKPINERVTDFLKAYKL